MAQWSFDELPSSPYEVLRVLFHSFELNELTRNINGWFYIIASHPTQGPRDSKICERVGIYLQDLLPLTEAMYFHYQVEYAKSQQPHQSPSDILESLDFSQLFWLKKSFAQYPSPIFKSFTQQYNRDFIRLMMASILETIEHYDGPLRLKEDPAVVRQIWSIAHGIAEVSHALVFHIHQDLAGNAIAPETLVN